MRENRADIELVCTREREKCCCVVGEKGGRREREMGGTLLHDLLHACVVLLFARVNGFYILYKTNHFMESFVLSFVISSFSIVNRL